MIEKKPLIYDCYNIGTMTNGSRRPRLDRVPSTPIHSPLLNHQLLLALLLVSISNTLNSKQIFFWSNLFKIDRYMRLNEMFNSFLPFCLRNLDFVCEDEGFFPNPKDCKKYFWCLESGSAGLVSHIFTCPSGSTFIQTN